MLKNSRAYRVISLCNFNTIVRMTKSLCHQKITMLHEIQTPVTIVQLGQVNKYFVNNDKMWTSSVVYEQERTITENMFKNTKCIYG